jgi:hypothetical protein
MPPPTTATPQLRGGGASSDSEEDTSARAGYLGTDEAPPRAVAAAAFTSPAP